MTTFTPSEEMVEPCPFCRGEMFVETDDEEFDIARACCQSCGACGPFVDLADHRTVKAAQQKATELWNTRAALAASPIGELVEALRDARSAIASLEEYALGGVDVPDFYSGETVGQYGIRDELLSKIDAALLLAEQGEGR